LKKIHKYLGLLMLLPFIAWAVTGVFFFIKPGYSDAYQSLPVKLYPLNKVSNLPVENQWLEVRQLRSVLGEHLLVKTAEGWQQLSPQTFIELKQPTTEQVRQLVNDAINDKHIRYGNIASITNLAITTSTEVRINLNWQQMTLRQQGKDTDFINSVYDIHYLRWTGIKTVDEVLGMLGLFFVVLLAAIGTVMTIKSKRNSKHT